MTKLYVGGPEHITVLRLQPQDEGAPELQVLGKSEVGEMPSFLAFVPNSDRLLAISEGGDRLVSLRETDTGLSRIDDSACGGGPAYVSVARDGTLVLTASYGSGEARAYSLSQEGKLSELGEALSTGKYSHCAVSSPDGKAFLCVSKGTDSIAITELRENQLVETKRVKTPEGSGPRHIVFSKDGKRAYVACENDCHLLSYRWEEGTLCSEGRALTIPRPMQEGDTGSDIHFSEDDRFVYVSNRGHDSLSVFRVDGAELELIQNLPSEGQVPRNFCLLPKMLICANQQSANLSFYNRDLKSGLLTLLGVRDVPERAFWVGNRHSF